MAMVDLLLEEFDSEMQKTRAMLAVVPLLPEFKPHEKSTKLGMLTAHTAQLNGFGAMVLTLPSLDFSTTKVEMATFDSTPQILALQDEGAAAARAALVALPESAWSDPWTLSYKDQVFFSGTRFVAYRQMYLNHVIHHRAQLGVYLRLNNVAIPGTYGPSADSH